MTLSCRAFCAVFSGQVFLFCSSGSEIANSLPNIEWILQFVNDTANESFNRQYSKKRAEFQTRRATRRAAASRLLPNRRGERRFLLVGEERHLKLSRKWAHKRFYVNAALTARGT